ncbi:uncharacterized protein LOC131179488 [Hevea brasiliensis]|uniref:uncharacterized protein LOC131179488 n=1 Tax=Hevea brasiliensis TaxID=3981 RepID=UPI0025D193DE|nr:uncharacterized protein LOC131179488 [Hevea brasiliensis]
MSIFLWSLLKERLPCSLLVKNRIPNVSPDYQFCRERETLRHAFFDCPRASLIWFHSPTNLRSTFLQGASAMDCRVELTEFLLKHNVGEELIQTTAFICWGIWKCRNLLLFNGQQQSFLEVLSLANSFQGIFLSKLLLLPLRHLYTWLPLLMLGSPSVACAQSKF